MVPLSALASTLQTGFFMAAKKAQKAQKIEMLNGMQIREASAGDRVPLSQINCISFAPLAPFCGQLFSPHHSKLLNSTRMRLIGTPFSPSLQDGTGDPTPSL